MAGALLAGPHRSSLALVRPSFSLCRWSLTSLLVGYRYPFSQGYESRHQTSRRRVVLSYTV